MNHTELFRTYLAPLRQQNLEAISAMLAEEVHLRDWNIIGKFTATAIIEDVLCNSLSAPVVTRRGFKSRRDRQVRQLDDFIKLFLFLIGSESKTSFPTTSHSIDLTCLLITIASNSS
jgi:hypothetical protein